MYHDVVDNFLHDKFEDNVITFRSKISLFQPQASTSFLTVPVQIMYQKVENNCWHFKVEERVITFR